MILEAIQYAATRAFTPAPFHPYIRSSVSLWSRARRCAKDWAPHEENCKTFIRETVVGMKERRTAVVLGSGLLRDVPVELLARAFDTVVLVDLVHPASVRMWLKAKRLHNTRLIWRDLSGFDEVMAGNTPEPLGFLRQVPYLDLVISADILSQIGVGATRKLAARGEAAKPDILSKLIAAHLDGLAGLPCKVALLTDTRLRATDSNGKLHEETDLLCGVPYPPAARQWNWPVVPFGEESRDYQVVHEVIATTEFGRLRR